MLLLWIAAYITLTILVISVVGVGIAHLPRRYARLTSSLVVCGSAVGIFVLPAFIVFPLVLTVVAAIIGRMTAEDRWKVHRRHSVRDDPPPHIYILYNQYSQEQKFGRTTTWDGNVPGGNRQTLSN